jgi:exodeoxyribonuclease X
VIEVDNQSAFVQPGVPIEQGAFETHGITLEMTVGGLLPSEARALLDKDSAILGAHNVAYDRQFVRSGKPWICTLECARKVWPKAPNHKLETLKEYLGIELEGDAHRAGYDAAVAARIFLHLTKHMTIEEMLERSTPESVPLLIEFGSKYRGRPFEDADTGYLKWIPTTDMRKGIKTAARLALQARETAPVVRSAGSAWDRSF